MSSIWMGRPVVRSSLIGPKSSAVNTGDRAASTSRCASKVSPPTRNVTSDSAPDERRRPRCWCRSDGGTVTNRGVSSARNSLETMISNLIAKQLSFR